jgi:hypothetical protein
MGTRGSLYLQVEVLTAVTGPGIWWCRQDSC